MHTSPFDALRCRVIDPDEARTTTHREVLLVMAQTFDLEGATILCEPSVVGGRSGPPDIAIVDPESGLHVVEVKGVELDQVKSVQAGGAIEIAYESNTYRKDPSRQARQAMFDVKDAATRHFGGDLNGAFESWVVFPRIRRAAWEAKFGEAVGSRPDVLFAEDLESSALGERLRRSGRARLEHVGRVPPLQLASLMAAFGDSAVLTPPPRPPAAAPEGSLGERLNESFAEHRALTGPQQRLAMQGWNDGPRLVRGVAGSGKTVVLATQVARMVERLRGRSGDLFESGAQVPALLAVCFNRTLVPFIRDRIEAAYRQRTCSALPDGAVRVMHFNTLMYDLSTRGVVRYRTIVRDQDPGERARHYLADLADSASRLDDERFHAIFVDEGQDFHEDEYRVLIRLCGRTPDESPRMFVFYDDAQNLYGRTRPTWTDLGLEVRGRSVVMDESFRNTRQILEPAFNVLIGSYAPPTRRMGTRGFADLATLSEKKLIDAKGNHVLVRFATREGDAVRHARYVNAEAESAAIADRVAKLVGAEGLSAHDLLVLTYRRERARALAGQIADRVGPDRVRCAFDDEEKDRLAIQRDRITVSTIASAKGYDAPYVFVASANEFDDNVEGRASFYVGCTRAREWLDVSAYGVSPIVAEFGLALAGVG